VTARPCRECGAGIAPEWRVHGRGSARELWQVHVDSGRVPCDPDRRLAYRDAARRAGQTVPGPVSPPSPSGDIGALPDVPGDPHTYPPEISGIPGTDPSLPHPVAESSSPESSPAVPAVPVRSLVSSYFHGSV
jgi:hypothetical protein